MDGVENPGYQGTTKTHPTWKGNKHLPNFGWHIVSSGEANNESCFKIDHQATQHEGSWDDTCAQSVPFRAWDFLATFGFTPISGEKGKVWKTQFWTEARCGDTILSWFERQKKSGMQATRKAAETNSSTISLKAMPNGWIPIKVFKRAKVLQGISHSNTWVF